MGNFLNSPFIPVLIIWSLAWKGLALWKAAHRNELKWFIALLVVNTAGILEILYLYVFTKPTGPYRKHGHGHH